MAIVQISKIQHRKGLQENLPQLAGAELGWSVDQRRLYIGNGTLDEGAPVIGNTEILTEFSDILSLASNYTYKGLAAGYEAHTGTTAGAPIKRSLQAKLDDFASVKDFGAVGDGETDDTAAINRAFREIFCREANPEVRRSLYFPAGVYKITDTILIPPYAKIWGEGANSTIIKLFSSDGSSIAEYVIRTVDSKQHYGGELGSNGAQTPVNIEVSSMTFACDLPTNILLIESAQHCYFDSVVFEGSLSTTWISNDPQNIIPNGTTSSFNLDRDFEVDTVKINGAVVSTSEYVIQPIVLGSYRKKIVFNTAPALTSTVEIRYQRPTHACVAVESTAAIVTDQISFDKCKFTKNTYGIESNYYSRAITVSNSFFTVLYRGVVLGESPSLGGPQSYRIVQNLFDQIAFEGIYFGVISKNISAYNVFYNVGNSFSDDYTPYSVIIDIRGNDNASVGDMFERSDLDAATYARIAVNQTMSIAFDSSDRVIFGRSHLQTGRYEFFMDNQSDREFLVLNSIDVNYGFTLNYTFSRGDTLRRKGKLTVIAGVADTSSSTLFYSDDYIENDNIGVTLTVTQDDSNIVISYSTENYGVGTNVLYSIEYLA